MHNISQQILKGFQIRKTKKQKDAFIALLKSAAPSLQVQESPIIKSRNLILGDVSSAKAVLTAHYDTCAKMLFPNFITPLQPLLAIGYSILISIPIFLIVFAANFLMRALGAPYHVYFPVSFLLIWGMLGFMMAGPANKHTVNDNTSGVITLLEIYFAMSEEERKEVAFVFFDNEELGLLGSSYFKNIYKKEMKNKLLINFDCVSDGDNFLIAASKGANKAHGEKILAAFQDDENKKVLYKKLENIYYPSDQAGFPVSLAVAALKHRKFPGYYMDKIHTKYDTVFMEENITYLTAHTLQFLRSF